MLSMWSSTFSWESTTPRGWLVLPLVSCTRQGPGAASGSGSKGSVRPSSTRVSAMMSRGPFAPAAWPGSPAMSASMAESTSTLASSFFAVLRSCSRYVSRSDNR